MLSLYQALPTGTSPHRPYRILQAGDRGRVRSEPAAPSAREGQSAGHLVQQRCVSASARSTYSQKMGDVQPQVAKQVLASDPH